MAKHLRTHNNSKSINANMTCLQGYVTVSYDRLVSLFGEPILGGSEDKVQAEWLIESNGVVATIYDWKRYGQSPQNNTDWHVGGHSKESVKLVEKFLK